MQRFAVRSWPLTSCDLPGSKAEATLDQEQASLTSSRRYPSLVFLLLLLFFVVDVRQRRIWATVVTPLWEAVVAPSRRFTARNAPPVPARREFSERVQRGPAGRRINITGPPLCVFTASRLRHAARVKLPDWSHCSHSRCAAQTTSSWQRMLHCLFLFSILWNFFFLGLHIIWFFRLITPFPFFVFCKSLLIAFDFFKSLWVELFGILQIQ